MNTEVENLTLTTPLSCANTVTNRNRGQVVKSESGVGRWDEKWREMV